MLMKINKKVFFSYALALLLLLPAVILAQITPTPAINVKAIIERFLNLIVWPLFAGASVLAFIWAGILYLTAQGDPGKISTANKAVIWGVVGIIIGLVGFSAVELLKAILQIP